ncbi:hypothetical protein K443DRAFT_5857 [Laccaria amethystina LaAM-08-1]|uniref:Uncharacterized protein n=1 Tax=Laccaria amethystina LaAM-08-1 TaxID=1095629 RepID=A0A0C9WUG4_9AGAR|nr:hypothetical protein K443DRAFT_5857 [Laccaria amethystina LaAM-08-1]
MDIAQGSRQPLAPLANFGSYGDGNYGLVASPFVTPELYDKILDNLHDSRSALSACSTRQFPSSAKSSSMADGEFRTGKVKKTCFYFSAI